MIENTKPPGECRDMSEIRAEIDALDQAVIQLLGKRFEYVQAASAFKKDEQAVNAPERVRQVMQKRREWAADVGLDPELIEKLYRDLVAYFIAEEKTALARNRQSDYDRTDIR